MDLKTISTFPDSDKLLYFIEILTIFNEKSDQSIYKLFEYVRHYSTEKIDPSLKTVAKITLANNLMISETNEESDFSLKNLKIINSYLNSGVLSLKETETDRLQRELSENVKYWRGIIKEDEGQNLEFKQTFLVPILDPIKDAYTEKFSKNDYDTLMSKRKKAIKHSAFKTLCAFANTNGGTLMIGVSDKKIITGLDLDFQSLKEPNRDGFGKRFDDEVKTYFGESFSHLLDKNYLMFDEGDVLIIKVMPSPEEVFMLRDEDGKDSEELYIRKLSSSEQLKGRELAKFIKRKHLDMLRTTVEN